MSSVHHAQNPRRAIQVLLVEDAGYQRDSLDVYVTPHRDLALIGSASDAAGALRLAARRIPDVLVVCLGHDASPAPIVRAIRYRMPAVRTVALLRTSDPAAARSLRAAGAEEVIVGTFRAAELVGAIRRLGAVAADDGARFD